jgi:hypothetical protein
VRRVLVLVGLTLALAFGAASAQPEPDPYARPIQPGHHMPRPQEIDGGKPSGFRMSGAPARGGAYRYRLMIVGAFTVMLATGLVVRYLRRINRERAARMT